MAHRKIHQYDELKKCGEDIVYFANNYYYVNSLEGKVLTELHPKQEIFLRQAQEGGFNAISAARQIRKTTTLQILALWTLLFRQNQRIWLDACNTITTEQIFDNIKKAHSELPKWMQLEDCYWSRDALSGQSEMFFFSQDENPRGMRLDNITLFLFDEMAWANATRQVRFKEIYPLLIADGNTNICVASTPNNTGAFDDIMNSKLFNKAVWTWKDSSRATSNAAIHIIKSVGLDAFLKEYMLID